MTQIRSALAVLLVLTSTLSTIAGGLAPDDKAAIAAKHRAICEPGELSPTTIDWAAFVKAHYTEDAVLLPPNHAAAVGHEAITAFFKTLPPLTAFKTVDLEIDGEGSTAFIRGTYSLSLTIPDGTSLTENGKYLEVWQKDANGTWACIRDMFSPDAPAAPVAE